MPGSAVLAGGTFPSPSATATYYVEFADLDDDLHPAGDGEPRHRSGRRHDRRIGCGDHQRLRCRDRHAERLDR
ncbi:MAG: hypothetical protein R2705_07330 [Ilumatobacteraceae bacterium]